MTAELDDQSVAEEIELERLAPDSQLSSLVTIANRLKGLSIPITLTVSGQQIAGHLVSGEEFFVGIQASIRSANSNPNADWGSLWDSAVKMYREMHEMSEEEADQQDTYPAFIHLKDAKTSLGLPIPNGLWRGRLASVDGWAIGAPA